MPSPGTIYNASTLTPIKLFNIRNPPYDVTGYTDTFTITTYSNGVVIDTLDSA
jgi:hypothetical protein